MSPFAALGLGATGLVTTVAGLAAQATDAGSAAAPYATGTGIGTLAAVLFYLFKQMMSGNLVSKPIAERIQEGQVVSAASMAREDRLQKDLIDSKRREAGYARKMEDVNRVLYQATEALKAMPK